jgi:hypothetical protein
MTNINLPSQFDSVIGLGLAQKVYRHSWFSKFAAVSAILAGSVISLFFFYFAYVYPTTFPDVAATNTPALYVMGGVGLLVTLYGAWRLLVGWSICAVLYPDGLAFFNGSEVLIFRWPDVAAIKMQVVQYSAYHVIPVGASHTYTITNQNGQIIKLDDQLGKVQELFEVVRKAVFPILMKRSVEALASGQTLTFGSITLSKAVGVQKGNKLYHWNELGRVSVDNGVVNIRPRKGGLFGGIRAPVSNIPNVDVLVTLLRQSFQTQRPASPLEVLDL